MMAVSEQIKVMEAYLAGDTLEWRFRLSRDGVPNKWRAHVEPGHQFNFHSYDYRVKPEPPKPREWWVVTASIPSIFPSAEEAREFLKSCFGCKAVRVREVLAENKES